MSEIKLTYTGWPAFPVSEGTVQFLGLSKREWFAGMALQVMTKNISLDDFERLKPEELAKGAFVIADSMIRAGKGENNNG